MMRQYKSGVIEIFLDFLWNFLIFFLSYASAPKNEYSVRSPNSEKKVSKGYFGYVSSPFGMIQWPLDIFSRNKAPSRGLKNSYEKFVYLNSFGFIE